MKKVVSLILVLALCLTLCLTLAACGGKTGPCEVCGKEASLNQVEVEGETGWVCDDCKATVDALAGLADLLG